MGNCPRIMNAHQWNECDIYDPPAANFRAKCRNETTRLEQPTRFIDEHRGDLIMKGSTLGGYILRRLWQTVPVILGVVVVNFLLLQLAPGDLATVLAGEAGGASPEFIEAMRERFGQDQPVYIQLRYYLGNLLTLDLGYSFRQCAPGLDLLLDRLAPTLLPCGASSARPTFWKCFRRVWLWTSRLPSSKMIFGLFSRIPIRF